MSNRAHPIRTVKQLFQVIKFNRQLKCSEACLYHGIEQVTYLSNISKFTFKIYGSNSTWLDSTRLDAFDFVEPVEQVETSVSSETSCALPTWRTTNDLVQV